MSTLKIDLKNTSGFGLLSMVVAMGLASIMIMMITDMLTYSASAQRGIQIKADRTAFMGELTNILLQDPTCTNSLKGNDVTKSLFMLDPANPAKKVAETGMHLQEWDIQSLELKNQQLVDQGMSLYSGDVFITLNHPIRAVGLTPITTKQIATIYYTAISDKITRCFGVSNVPMAGKSFCTTMGGTWSDSAIQCTLPSVAAANTATTPTVNTLAENDRLTVSEVVASATGSNNNAVNNTPAANVVTGVDHNVGKGSH